MTIHLVFYREKKGIKYFPSKSVSQLTSLVDLFEIESNFQLQISHNGQTNNVNLTYCEVEIS